MYIVYGVTAGLAAFVCFGILIDLPAWAKPWVLLLLILVLLAWIVNLALTAVLRYCAWQTVPGEPPLRRGGPAAKRWAAAKCKLAGAPGYVRRVARPMQGGQRRVRQPGGQGHGADGRQRQPGRIRCAAPSRV